MTKVRLVVQYKTYITWRNDMKSELSQSLEDYLSAIYILSRDKNFVHAHQVAEQLQVSKSSVSWALNQLAERGLIHYKPYEAITLTEDGQQQALLLTRRHDEIKRFLMDVLAVDEVVAQANACRLEHVIDKEVAQRLRSFMYYLESTPAGSAGWKSDFDYFCVHGHWRGTPQGTSEKHAATAHHHDAAGLPNQPLPKVSKSRDQNMVERLRQVLQEGGRVLSERQEAVIEEFLGQERHQSLEDILHRVRPRHSEITLDEVAMAMQVLCEHKLARGLRFEDQVVYEHFHPESHHDHLYCVKCGAIIEFYDPRIELLQIANARRADFRLLQHNLSLYGVCDECIERETRTRPLTACLAGENLEINRIDDEESIRKRLGDMGLQPGAFIEMISADAPGKSVMVMAGMSRLTLDRSLAEKIKVSPAPVGQLPLQIRRHRARHRHQPDRGVR